MRRLPTTFALAAAVLAAACLAARADEKDDAAKKELELLKGRWVTVSMAKDGKEMPLPRENGPTLTIAADGAYVVKAGDSVLDKGVGKVDPGKAPKALDIAVAEGPDKGKTLPAIYEVKGDELRVCWADAGKPRPSDFTSKEGSGRTLVTYKRAK